jgi:predicted nucleotidyltransferase
MERNTEFGLHEVTIKKINKVFSGYPEIEKAVIYGSRAKGNPKPGSDIDLTLFGERLTANILLSVGRDIDDLLLPYTIDLSIYHHIKNDELLNHIKRVGKVFFTNHP